MSLSQTLIRALHPHMQPVVAPVASKSRSGRNCAGASPVERKGRPVQSLNTLEVKDSELESSLVSLESALRDLDAFPDVHAERAAAVAAREDLQQRVAAQQALEDTMASVRGISKAEGV